MLRRLLGRLSAGAPPPPGETAEALALRYQAHFARGEYAQAAEALEAVLEVRPDWTDARFNLGGVLIELGRLPEAEVAYRRVIEQDPQRLMPYRMLGHVLHRQGRIADLLEVLAAARRRHPADFELESFELLALLFAEEPSPQALAARHRDFGARLERAVRPMPSAPPLPSGQRLRVGYVSGDFCHHPVAQFVRPLLERHDRSAFEVFCYSVGTKADAFTRRLAALSDVWRDAAKLTDDQLAAAIRADGIEVLVDLSGHSGASRLGVFARQPARVQLAWLGYLHTTGLTRIQFRICDPYTDPEGSEALHTERLLRLPHCQWCYQPLVEPGAPGPRPLERNGFVTFGSFNQVAKLSSTSRRLWAEILRALPSARLLMLGIPEGVARQRLYEDFARGGIDGSRLTVLGHLPVAEYFGRIAATDIALDTSPYSGGTTTCDTLWMGVPVVTLAGERSAGRSAASILHTLGLGEWISRSPEEYVALALGAAREPARWSTLRAGLRERMRASPLADETAFARDMEAAYRAAHRAYS
jgi:predicted O-linked N-acetylglucosamine transferase (SPINDLY family)